MDQKLSGFLVGAVILSIDLFITYSIIKVITSKERKKTNSERQTIWDILQNILHIFIGFVAESK